MDVKVLNFAFQAIAILDNVESFFWVERFDRFGEFELYTGMDLATYNVMQNNYYLQIPESNKLMVIESSEIRTDVENGNKLVVKGRSLESILDRRIVITRTQLDTNLQAGIKTLLTDPFMNPAQDWRVINNFIFNEITNPAVTTAPFVGQFWWDNIYDVVSAAAQANDVGFKLTFNESTGKIVFEFVVGVNRSFDQSLVPFVVFSPRFDNLLTSSYLQTIADFKTNVWIKGDDSDGNEVHTALTLAGYGSGSPNILKREHFVDASDLSKFASPGVLIDSTTYANQLKFRGTQDVLNNHWPKQYFDADVESSYYKYGTDYNLGDFVQIENEYGVGSKAQVVEITFSQNESGYKIYPTFSMV